MESQMMQGVFLMLIGMATVVVFLLVMIVAINLSAAFFRKFAHLFPEPVASAPAKKTAADPAAQIAVVLAAIRAKRG